MKDRDRQAERKTGKRKRQAERHRDKKIKRQTEEDWYTDRQTDWLLIIREDVISGQLVLSSKHDQLLVTKCGWSLWVGIWLQLNWEGKHRLVWSCCNYLCVRSSWPICSSGAGCGSSGGAHSDVRAGCLDERSSAARARNTQTHTAQPARPVSVIYS